MDLRSRKCQQNDQMSQFNCPVCLDLPNDPVTIPCGHSYCMACIKDYWSKDDPNGVYSCPQCRQTFCPRPSLSRNTMLAEAVDQLRRGIPRSVVSRSIKLKTQKRLPSSAVQCDLCQGEQKAAVKTCLVCMSSYCENHLKPHQTTKALKEHELIVPTANLADKICTQHKYLQEFFCRQCKVFICWLCTSNQHKGHESVSTKAERTDKEVRPKGLSEMQAENQRRLKDRQQELKDMKKMMDGMKRSADRVHSDSEKVLLDLQHSVERLQELLEEVLDEVGREKMEQAREVTENLEAEIKELQRRETQMKDLAQSEDHIYYLQAKRNSNPLESGDLPAVQVNHDASFEPVRDAILDLRERVEDLCNLELDKITKKVREISLDSIQAPEPRAREDLLQYSVNFTFDPNSAHRRLLLSEGNTKATLQGEMVPYADTPQRFDGWTQVMCGTPLHSQRSYWEVEWRGRGSSVGVAYGSLSRKGSDARAGLGYNAQSWTLELSDSCCCALHDNQKRDIPVTYSPRLGVFVDLNTGTLSFYGVAESLTPLHTFRANFTQPLYAVFGVGSGLGVGLDFARGQFSSTSDSVKLCPM
uniref:Tripartite motif containing 25, like n=1 Tax=Hippocampus comes TaxID=109280 RepID=A0A3Q2XZ37_HIPCM